MDPLADGDEAVPSEGGWCLTLGCGAWCWAVGLLPFPTAVSQTHSTRIGRGMQSWDI